MTPITGHDDVCARLLAAAGISVSEDAVDDGCTKLAAAAGIARIGRRASVPRPGPTTRPLNTTSSQITPRTNPASYHLTPKADGSLPARTPRQGMIPAPTNPAAKPAQAPASAGRGSWTS